MINKNLLRIPFYQLAGCDFFGSWEVEIILSSWNIHWVFLINMALFDLLLNRVISPLDMTLDVT